MSLTAKLGAAQLGSLELGAAGGAAPATPAPAVYAPELTIGPPMRGAPWAFRRYQELTLGQVSTFLAPTKTPVYAPEIQQGPPLRGAPWTRRVIHEQRLQQASTFLARPSANVYAPELTLGPPMRGAPWVGARLLPAEGGLLRGTVVLPGNRGGPGVPQRPFVPRVPNQSDARRMARFTEMVSSILNSLIFQGALAQTGPSTWELAGTSAAATATTGLSGTFNSAGTYS